MATMPLSFNYDRTQAKKFDQKAKKLNRSRAAQLRMLADQFVDGEENKKEDK